MKLYQSSKSKSTFSYIFAFIGGYVTSRALFNQELSDQAKTYGIAGGITSIAIAALISSGINKDVERSVELYNLSLPAHNSVKEKIDFELSSGSTGVGIRMNF